MSKITFLVDSGSDYESYLATYFSRSVKVVPLHLHLNNKQYLDGVTISKKSFYKEMEKSSELPKTSQPSPQVFLDFYKQELEQGNKVLFIGISSKLSGTIQSAELAKNMLSQEEQNEIYIVDSLNVSATVLLLLLHADKLLGQGLPIEEVIKEIEIRRPKVKFIALLDTLENLKKGGRVSVTQYTIGGILNIKPLITIEDGLVKSLDKFRGRKKGLKHLSEFINDLANNLDRSIIFLAHSFMDEKRLQEEIQEIDLSNFKEVVYIKIGATIGTHAGANTIALIYQGK